ncbi:MAG: hypothetical protein BGO98_42035 [Myxococcales bacterium 68-20]|nr:DUF3047 domain-containing protein [Myxococcales bacterium]OJY27837.1 MAG: hypothetical protein BGO98_42035 [Myxococcales bacterium 68-20]
MRARARNGTTARASNSAAVRPSSLSALVLVLVLAVGLVPRTARAADVTIEPTAWQIVKQKSGPVNYYSVVTEDGLSFVRSRYAPPMKTAVLGYQVAEADRQRIKKVKWTWRAQALPTGGDECASGKGDSAAVVYLTWKRGLRYYTLKYVWSAVGQVGRVCDSKRNPFVAQDTVILQSGGPTGSWTTEEIDLASAYRRHFAGGNPNAEVPSFVGLGLMSDGDQTSTPSSADYGKFVLVR